MNWLPGYVIDGLGKNIAVAIAEGWAFGENFVVIMDLGTPQLDTVQYAHPLRCELYFVRWNEALEWAVSAVARMK